MCADQSIDEAPRGVARELDFESDEALAGLSDDPIAGSDFDGAYDVVDEDEVMPEEGVPSREADGAAGRPPRAHRLGGRLGAISQRTRLTSLGASNGPEAAPGVLRA